MKISLKMLLLTLGSFIILIIGILASLYFYFDHFYQTSKINQITKAINEFNTSYISNNWSEEKLYSEVSRFMKKQNVTMSITPSVSISITTAKNGSSSSMVTSKIDSDFLVLSSCNQDQLMEFPALPSITSLSSTPVDVVKHFFKIKASAPFTSISYHTGTTTIVDGSLILYPVTYSGIVTDSRIQTRTKDGVTYSISTIPYTNYKQVNFSKLCTLKNGDKKMTTVNLSLQSADDIMDFLKSIFPFMIAAVLLLSFIMVAVYSRTITKPIVQITDISNRMAGMELGIVSTINRKDELGILSTSLNTLSSNLKNALDELSSANEQLKADYEAELRQEKVRREFVANVSHELKTPLGIIRSYSEGIRDGIKTEKRDYYLEVILDEITRMDQMLMEMLEISKFDAGAVKYHKRMFDIRSLTDKSMQLFRKAAGSKNVSFRIEGTWGEVFADDNKIERVLLNLIGNAVKYCYSDSDIVICGEQTENKQIISIKNDCQQLSEEVLSKIWDRFYKADTSHSREIEGTGLGLSITKSILDGHCCKYGVNNTDTGICFYFELSRIADD